MQVEEGEEMCDGLRAFNWNLELRASSHSSVPNLMHDTENSTYALHACLLTCKSGHATLRFLVASKFLC